MGAPVSETRKAPLGETFEGAIKLVRYGFPVNQDLGAALNNGGGAGSLKLHKN